ncbi:uncharacterized protein TNCV_1741971 [Trichonephila clavipes]|nr:uncharacterized protein TNCV_1741971 [Trichonephila clavipes]
MILTIIVDYSRDVGVSTDEEMYILMCLSISDMIGRFGLGLFLGGLLIVCPGIISDHIEKDKVTMALASRFVFYAPMSLTQSSLIGFFRGTKGSYKGILYMLSAICLFCCVISLSIPFAARFRDKRKKNIKSQIIKNSLPIDSTHISRM